MVWDIFADNVHHVDNILQVPEQVGYKEEIDWEKMPLHDIFLTTSCRILLVMQKSLMII
jgi:hypothetical protein